MINFKDYLSKIREKQEQLKEAFVTKQDKLTIVDKKLKKVYNETDDYIYDLQLKNCVGDVWGMEYTERYMNAWRGQSPKKYRVGDDVYFKTDKMYPISVAGIDVFNKKIEILDRKKLDLITLGQAFHEDFKENPYGPDFTIKFDIYKKEKVFYIFLILIYKKYIFVNIKHTLQERDLFSGLDIKADWEKIIRNPFSRSKDVEEFLYSQLRKSLKLLLKDNKDSLLSLKEDEILTLKILN